MKPSKHSAVEVESTFETLENFEMTIDPNAMAHLMHLLTNLYSDEELACIREYSTNAWDAHIEAGTTDRPIEVSLPTKLSPNLVIKDYGVGMDVNDIANIYSRYGATTKDLTNEQNGSMGIGGKAALAYTSQFTVIGTKNGIVTTVVVSRNIDGGGSMQIIGRVKTDEPNGVEIIIPAKPFNNIKEKAHDYFRFWKPGTVLVDGEDPSAKLRKISEHIYEFEDPDEIDRDYVVMGNVAYPVEHGKSFSRTGGYVAFVSMDDDERVVFTPPREALIYNTQTLKVLEMLRTEYHDYIVEYVQTEIDKCEVKHEAYSFRNELVKRHALDSGGFTYHGEEIPATGETAFEGDYIRWNVGRYRNAVETHADRKLSINILESAVLLVIGYPGKTGVSAPHKTRIKQYLREKMNVTYYRWEYIYLFKADEGPDNEWLDKEKQVSWKTILEETRDPKANSGGGSRGGPGADAYDYWDRDGYHVGLPPENAIVYYYSSADCSHDFEVAKALFKRNKRTVIIQANRNRWAKLKRRWPKARQYSSYELRTELGDKAWKKIPQKKKDAMALYFGYRRLLQYQDQYVGVVLSRKGKILDKDFIAVYEALDLGAKTVKEYETTLARHSQGWAGLTRYPENVDCDFDFSKYPLRNWNNPDATVEYINALYRCRELDNKEDK